MRDRFYRDALHLIHRHGFKGTSMRMIADRMNCDVSNLYNYIESKHQFLAEILFSLSREFHNRLEQILESGYDPANQLQLIIRMYVEMSFQKPLEMSLLVNEWRHLREPEQQQFMAERSEFEAKMKKLLKKGIHSGQFKKIDAEVATHLVLSSCRWLFDHFSKKNGAPNPLELERQIYGFVINGLEN